jgi:guanylate kinase
MKFLTHMVTRELREGEVNGLHATPIPRDAFEYFYMRGDIATRTEYAGNLYGAPRWRIEEIKLGTPYHATATKESIEQFKALLGEENVVTIYIKPPSVEVLRERMGNRGDSAGDIERRIAHIFSAAELENESIADYVVVNDNLDTAIENVKSIIRLFLDNDGI